LTFFVLALIAKVLELEVYNLSCFSNVGIDMEVLDLRPLGYQRAQVDEIALLVHTIKYRRTKDIFQCCLFTPEVLCMCVHVIRWWSHDPILAALTTQIFFVMECKFQCTKTFWDTKAWVVHVVRPFYDSTWRRICAAYLPCVYICIAVGDPIFDFPLGIL